jgi:hypothetical protein
VPPVNREWPRPPEIPGVDEVSGAADPPKWEIDARDPCAIPAMRAYIAAAEALEYDPAFVALCRGAIHAWTFYRLAGVQPESYKGKGG